MGDDWHRICRVDDLADEEVIGFEVGQITVAVYKTGGDVFATTDECAHLGASLVEGFVEGGEVECPLHQCRYAIATGEALAGPAVADLATYPVETEDGWIHVHYAEDIE